MPRIIQSVTKELITLRTYGSLPEALLVRAQFDSAGIACVLADDNVSRVFSSVVPGGVKLQVAPEDEVAARNLLEEAIPPRLVDEESGLEYTQPQCPNCESLDVSTVEDVTPTPGFDDLKCEACGHHWKQKEDTE